MNLTLYPVSSSTKSIGSPFTSIFANPAFTDNLVIYSVRTLTVPSVAVTVIGTSTTFVAKLVILAVFSLFCAFPELLISTFAKAFTVLACTSILSTVSNILIW